MTDKNGTGVCDWDDWRGLSEEVKEYEQWRVLDMLGKKMSGIEKTVKIYAFTGGCIGGGVTILGLFGIKLTCGI